MGRVRKLGNCTAAGLLWGSLLVRPAFAFDLPCTPDDTLSETAAELLLSGEALAPARLLPKARGFGFDGVAVQAHDGLEDAALIGWLKAQSERADAPLVCGEARSESRRLVLVSARGGRLAYARGRVSGSLAPGFRKPHLVVEDGEGRARRIDVQLDALARGVALPQEVDAKRIQLVASGPNGPRPVAEVALGSERPAPPPPAPPPVTAPDAGATAGTRSGSRGREALFARLTAFRRNEGVPGLRENQLLAHSAQRHAERVCELGKVAHRLGEGDDPETRLREERIEARSVGEAVARASSADAALSAMFDSPSHRMAVIERGFTDAGIGQALDGKGHTCLVVLLASWPRRIP
jgi:uncharacterized protein YkwD